VATLIAGPESVKPKLGGHTSVATQAISLRQPHRWRNMTESFQGLAPISHVR
jgi:hypothetical protein